MMEFTMPTVQKVIAVVEGDTSQIKKQVDWIIPQTGSVAEWEAKANEIADGMKAPNVALNLVFTGGHGDCAATGEPRLLNGVDLEATRKKIQILKDKGLKFKAIVLNPCCSASFIPLFQDLLTDDGVIFCQLASSVRNANAVLDLANVNHGDVFSAFFAQLEKLRCNLKEVLPGSCPFPSDAVYTHRNRRLNRLHVANITKSLQELNQMVAAEGELKDTASEIMALSAWLQTQGISTRDYHLDPTQLELSVRALCQPPVVQPMVKADFQEILQLEPLIFPAERRFTESDLNGYFDAKYSFVAKSPDFPSNIVGYVFAHVVGSNIFIGNLGVHPCYQGAGIGAGLLKEVVTIADREGKGITLQVRAQNAAAIGLYTKMGFVITSKDDTWAHMTRPMNAQTLALAPGIIPAAPQKKGVSWSFILMAVVSVTLGAGLIALACVLLPPLGLISLTAIAGYTLSGLSFASSAGLFGFFGYQVSKELKEKVTPMLECV
jgi:ribosomal protein S18 acetylase RimI-like enzyme